MKIIKVNRRAYNIAIRLMRLQRDHIPKYLAWINKYYYDPINNSKQHIIDDITDNKFVIFY